MARSPEFHRDAVLTNAMTTFWRQGYEATSMADLLAATGLSKSSLYSEFGSKHALFLEAYDRYRAQQGENLRSILSAHAAPEGIRAFFEQIITGTSSVHQNFGCMTTNQAIERGADDQTVRHRVNADYQHLEDGFADHLREGQRAGTVSHTVDVDMAASALVTAFSGFQLTVRADLDRARLRRALDYLLTPLIGTPARS